MLKTAKGASTRETSRHLDCSREQLARLEAQGIIERLPDGGYDLDKTRVAYIRWLRERPQKSSKREHLYELQSQIKEHQLATQRHETVKLSESAEAHKALVLGVVAMSYTMAAALVRSLNAFTNRDVKKMIDDHVRQFLNALAAMAEAQTDSLAGSGKMDMRAADHFFGLASADRQPPGEWIPPRPSLWDPGENHKNSGPVIHWRVRCGLRAAPHKTDAEIAKFCTIVDPDDDDYARQLTTVKAAQVAEIRADEAKKMADLQHAVDRYQMKDGGARR
jgi:hypothetical protein